MIQLPIQVNNLQNIISQKIFMASEIIPLAIQKDPADTNKKQYKVLFKLTENITQTSIFFEIRVLAEDDIDRSYIQSKAIYIDNLRKNPDKFNAFKEVMKDFSDDKFYLGDLNFRYSPNDANYHIDGIKGLLEPNTNTLYYESMRIFINRQMFIILSLYVQDLIDPYNGSDKEYLFASKAMSNMRFEKGEKLKLIATCKGARGSGEQVFWSYNTMYEINCGPTFWKFTYEIITEEDLEPKEPLGASIFNPEYSQYNDRYIGTVVDGRDLAYIILKTDNDKVVAIVSSASFIQEKTNLIDPYTIFIDKFEDDDKEDNNDEPSIEDIIKNNLSTKEEISSVEDSE